MQWSDPLQGRRLIESLKRNKAPYIFLWHESTCPNSFLKEQLLQAHEVLDNIRECNHHHPWKMKLSTVMPWNEVKMFLVHGFYVYELHIICMLTELYGDHFHIYFLQQA